MRFCFVDVTEWDYVLSTPWEQPLGGMQSALCYLAQALSLAGAGHRVCVFNRTRREGRYERVFWYRIADTDALAAAQIAATEPDVVIVLAASGWAAHLRPHLASHTRAYLWTGHGAHQPASAALRTHLDHWDGVLLVSAWQMSEYERHLGVPRSRMLHLPNAIGAPVEHNLELTPCLAPRLIYCSVPSRGLAPLLEAWPEIRRQVPAAELRVFAGMNLYFDEQADLRMTALYEACERLGVVREKAVGQTALARALAASSMLAYPTVVPETSCIVAMEALASGCAVVTSDLGGLSETTAGFGHLLPFPFDAQRQRFVSAFTQEVVSVLQTPAAVRMERARAQQQFFRQHTWARRAAQLVELLTPLCQRS